MSESERVKVCRKILGARQDCVGDQGRNDRNVATQRFCNFNPNEVIRIVDSTFSGFIACAQPLWTNYCYKYLAAAQVLIEDGSEVLATFDVVDVDKELVFAKGATKSLVNAASFCARIITAVAQKNPVAHWRPTEHNVGRNRLTYKSESRSHLRIFGSWKYWSVNCRVGRLSRGLRLKSARGAQPGSN